MQVRGAFCGARRKRKHSMPYWAKKRSMFIENHLTSSNKAFIDEVASDMNKATESKSPLKESAWPRGEWDPKTVRTGLIARKIGIYPMWTKSGTKLLTTLLHVLDNHVIDYIPPELYAKTLVGHRYKGRYGSLILGAERRNPKIFTQDYCELFEKAGVTPKVKLRRFLITPNATIQPGTPLFATHFRVGDYVDVSGLTIDRGFQGVVKRWEFKGGPKSHGSTKFHRRPGTIGTGRNMGRVWPGKKMPGHTGLRRRRLIGLKILRINTKYNVIWVKGPAVPGCVNGFVTISDSVLPTRKHQTPPPFPTHYPEETQPLPEDIYDAELHDFSQPTILYEGEPEITIPKPVKAGSKAQKRAR